MLTITEIQTKLAPVFREYDVQKAILFGSYAKGLQQENSDVDICVDSRLKGLAFYGLLEKVVTTLGKRVDLIDVRQIKTNSQIDIEIKKTGVVIYEQ